MADQQPPMATAENAPWGLYDTQDHCWIGDDVGPAIYTGDPVTFEIARISEAMINERFGHAARIRLCVYDGSGTNKKDDVTPRRTLREAFRRRGIDDDEW